MTLETWLLIFSKFLVIFKDLLLIRNDSRRLYQHALPIYANIGNQW